MTPEQRAKQLVDDWWDDLESDASTTVLQDMIALAIADAVAAERADCADICDQHSRDDFVAQECRDAILARGKP